MKVHCSLLFYLVNYEVDIGKSVIRREGYTVRGMCMKYSVEAVNSKAFWIHERNVTDWIVKSLDYNDSL